MINIYNLTPEQISLLELQIQEYKKNQMKPVKFTLEYTITPKEFFECHSGDLIKLEDRYKLYITNVIKNKIGAWSNVGEYNNFINKTIPNIGNGMSLTTLILD